MTDWKVDENWTNPHRHGKETAKKVRAELKERGLKLSVRSGRWSYFDYVDIKVPRSVSDEDWKWLCDLANRHYDRHEGKYATTGTSVIVTPVD